MNYLKKKGFTLIELLVVVIIIAVLAAVAVPMYKRAVLKSRFSTVMPMAKAVADAQEVYYLGNGQYALSQAELDVTPVEAEHTAVALSTQAEEEKYAYVAANRTDYPSARYIMYQKHSPKFAGNIHCEASDEQAEWLCEKGLGGQLIEGSIGGGDTKTYLLEGSASGENDYFAKSCEGNGEKACACGGPVTGSCDDRTGSWSYTNDCPTPLPDETVACGSGFTGNKTRKATCNGTTYEYGAWDTSGCVSACTDPKPTPYTYTAYSTGATGTMTCVNGQWQYVWTGGRTYNSTYYCRASSLYGCAGGTYSGKNTFCFADAVKGCAGSTFSGNGAYCQGFVANGCTGSTFSGDYTECDGRKANACAGSTFSGNQAYCGGYAANGCTGAVIQAGAYCNANTSGGCDGALYGAHPDKDPSLLGSCNDSSGYCPTGVPLQGSWNSTTQAYDYTWKGNCCNPAYMVSGECPSGIAVCQ